jgi:hypothetical protein
MTIISGFVSQLIEIMEKKPSLGSPLVEKRRECNYAWQRDRSSKTDMKLNLSTAPQENDPLSDLPRSYNLFNNTQKHLFSLVFIYLLHPDEEEFP